MYLGIGVITAVQSERSTRCHLEYITRIPIKDNQGHSETYE